MPGQDKGRRKPDDGVPDKPEYEKPSIAWEQAIDVKRLSVGCTRQEFNLVCQDLGTPFGS